MGDADTPTDERDLVERARTDANAFAELYRRYVDRIHAFAYRRTGSRAAAEDITSATFEAALRGLPSFRWRAGGVAPWLFRIAANQTAGHHRREGRSKTERGQRAMAMMTTSEFVQAEPAAEFDDYRLRAALDAISPRYQRAISLRYLTGLETDAAAQAMRLAPAAFAVVLSRARKALARELERRTP